MTVICDSRISEEEKNQLVADTVQRHKGHQIDGITISIYDDEYVDIKVSYAPVAFDRIRRITGYLVGNTSRWNNAKLSELKDRTKNIL